MWPWNPSIPLSLNPKKSQFAMQEGKLFGHIVSTKGIDIDPARAKEIQTVKIPKNKKEV